ncbi:MAG: hypothetical protein K8H99_09230, partial [Nitrospirae bacterium]|nr:hypothetical protein [Fimbriimonadaceae bacterium]
MSHLHHRLRQTLLGFIVAGTSGLAALVPACIWDHDTIKMERSRFPTALELITGKFLRHSPEFYRWRIEDRLKKLETDPNDVRALDDLAAAYDKTGQHDRAIEVARSIEKIQPGRYETAANLGTFLIHAGRLEEGLEHIERAIEINPDAHFGREVVQKQLVQYVLARRASGATLPLGEFDLSKDGRVSGRGVKHTFLHHLRSEKQASQGRNAHLERAELDAAIKGVLGMMRFGTHDSPVLLEALGFLLAADDLPTAQDAKLLASRAFLMASMKAEDGQAKAAYRALAEGALVGQTPGRGTDQITLEEVEETFQRELADAESWYADLRSKEIRWVSESDDPEAEFDKLYA